DAPNQRLAVQYATPIRRPEDLAKTVVAVPPAAAAPAAPPPNGVDAAAGAAPGRAPLLGRGGTPAFGKPPPAAGGVVNDEAGLLVVVEKYPWANTLEVTRAVEQRLEELRPALPNVEMTTTIFRPATFIELALANLRVAVLIGCALVALIVVAFLFE